MTGPAGDSRHAFAMPRAFFSSASTAAPEHDAVDSVTADRDWVDASANEMALERTSVALDVWAAAGTAGTARAATRATATRRRMEPPWKGRAI